MKNMTMTLRKLKTHVSRRARVKIIYPRSDEIMSDSYQDSKFGNSVLVMYLE